MTNDFPVRSYTHAGSVSCRWLRSPCSSKGSCGLIPLARRLTQPYVTWSLLVAEFNELAAEVASKYFTELPSGRYAFRPSYNRRVERRIRSAHHARCIALAACPL